MKRRFMAFGLGVLTLLLVGAVTFLTSGDIRLIYAIGTVLLLCLAIWLGASGKPDWFAAMLLYLPLLAGFGVLLLPKLPALWPILLLWAVAVVIGLVFIRATRARHGLPVTGMMIVLIAASLWYCISYVPKLLARELNHFGNVTAPAFTLQPISNGSVPVTSERGKILVIDFFATWCPPCKAELPELEAIRDELKTDADIQFVLVDTNAGGDTPERFRSFAQSRHVTLPLAFDPDGKARASFGMTGFPSLVVIDRTGRVRLTREGYNPAEANFRRDFVRFLKTL